MPVAAAILPLPFAILLSVTASQSGQVFPGEEIDPTPFIIAGIILYLAFGAVSGIIAAIFIRNASYGMSAVIGMATTVGGGLVFAGFFGLIMLISLLAERIGLRFSDPIDIALGVVALAILLAIVIATFVVMVILIRKIGRNAPE